MRLAIQKNWQGMKVTKKHREFVVKVVLHWWYWQAAKDGHLFCEVRIKIGGRGMQIKKSHTHVSFVSNDASRPEPLSVWRQASGVRPTYLMVFDCLLVWFGCWWGWCATLHSVPTTGQLIFSSDTHKPKWNGTKWRGNDFELHSGQQAYVRSPA